MKILFILSSYNINGGTPKKTLDLLNRFREDAVLYLFSPSAYKYKDQFKQTDATIIEGDYGRNIFLHLWRLNRVIRNYNIDIIQTQFSFGEMLGYGSKLLNPRIKLVTSFVTPFRPTFHRKIFLNMVYPYFDSFIAVSDYVYKEKLLQFNSLRNAPFRVIYNGAENRAQKLVQEATIETRFNLLEIAGLSYWKNIEVLIRSMHILVNVRNREEIVLKVAGDGPNRLNLEILINSLNLSKNVTLLGYRDDIGDLLNAADIFVHSAYAEGFGIVVPEAMLHGLPVIVSRAGALPELVEHGETGYIVDPMDEIAWADAIERLYTNEELILKLGQRAKQIAKERFSIDRFYEDYLKLYQELLLDN